MAGCRALTTEEQTKIIANLGSQRDKTLFILGLKTGFRISELLSLRLKDVWASGLVDRVRVQRRSMKGKARSRDIVLHPEAKAAVERLVMIIKNEPDSYLFQSRHKGCALSRFQAAKVLKDAFTLAGLTGPGLGTHCWRKTFAAKVYEITGKDLVLTQAALGHSTMDATVSYLQTNKSAVDAAVLA